MFSNNHRTGVWINYNKHGQIIFKEKFKQTKYIKLINDINAFAPVKFIAEAKKEGVTEIDQDFVKMINEKRSGGS